MTSKVGMGLMATFGQNTVLEQYQHSFSRAEYPLEICRSGVKCWKKGLLEKLCYTSVKKQLSDRERHRCQRNRGGLVVILRSHLLDAIPTFLNYCFRRAQMCKPKVEGARALRSARG